LHSVSGHTVHRIREERESKKVNKDGWYAEQGVSWGKVAFSTVKGGPEDKKKNIICNSVGVEKRSKAKSEIDGRS